MNFTVEEQIVEAIKNKLMISFVYIEKDTRRDIRKAAPLALFVSTLDNKNIDAFQYEGYSKKGDLPAWRQFTIDNICDLVILKEHFSVVHGYNPFSKQYNRAICKI